MATMLGFVTTDAAVPQALLDRALREAVERHVQRDHRRRRVLDQRLRDAARQRRQRRRRSTRRSYAAFVAGLTRGLPRAGARHRPRRRRRDQAGHRQRHRRGVERRGAQGGEGDRQLAARQDRHPRRRSELGPADLRSPAAPASPFELVARRGDDRIDRAVQGRPAARRSWRRRRPSI